MIEFEVIVYATIMIFLTVIFFIMLFQIEKNTRKQVSELEEITETMISIRDIVHHIEQIQVKT